MRSTGPFTYLPFWDPGGESPVVMYLRHSMMVVLPQPFWPRMRTRGQGRAAMTWPVAGSLVKVAKLMT